VLLFLVLSPLPCLLFQKAALQAQSICKVFRPCSSAFPLAEGLQLQLLGNARCFALATSLLGLQTNYFLATEVTLLEDSKER
jgi:hypothetical protein